ncbi:hypothetical protein [Pseudoxanthomonas winnipegensis]|nr:hypothetical protein [Pseudoxanthomonas winnipegensis]
MPRLRPIDACSATQVHTIEEEGLMSSQDARQAIACDTRQVPVPRPVH